MLVAVFELQDHFSRPNLALDLAQRRLSVFRMHKVKEWPRQKLLHAPAQRMRKGRTEAFEIAIRIGDAQHVQRKRKKPVAFGLCPLALADVAQVIRHIFDTMNDMSDASGRIEDRRIDWVPVTLLKSAPQRRGPLDIV